MNDTANPAEANNNESVDESTSGAGKAISPSSRNPVERVVVWGLILAMLALVSVEAYAKFSYDATFERLTKAIDDAQAEGRDITVDEIAGLISGSPSRTETPRPNVHGAPKTDIDYHWWSLFKTYRIVVYASVVDSDGVMVVTGFDTDKPPIEEPQATADNNGEGDGQETPVAPMRGIPTLGGPSGGHASGGGPGAFGGPGGGGPGGRPPLEFTDLDADADGQLSSEELPEFMRERFADIDTDDDDAISAEEFENRPRRGQGGGDAAAETATPDRPELETPESETDT